MWQADLHKIDPVRIAKKIGINVRKTEMTLNIASVIFKEKDKCPIIVLNENDSDELKRITCSFALGYILQNPYKSQYYIVNNRNMAYKEVYMRERGGRNG